MPNEWICQEISHFRYFGLPVCSCIYCGCANRDIGFCFMAFAGLKIQVNLGTLGLAYEIFFGLILGGTIWSL